MSGPYAGSQQQFAAAKIITTGTGTTAIVASPGVGKHLCVQGLNWVVTVAAAQAFTFDDGTTTLVSSPASQAVGWYGMDYGELGIKLAANTALSYTATAGVAMTISVFGYVLDDAGG